MSMYVQTFQIKIMNADRDHFSFVFCNKSLERTKQLARQHMDLIGDWIRVEIIDLQNNKTIDLKIR